MGRGLLVAGTGTGVGKTAVAAGLARLLADGGVRTGVMKPAATGVPPDDDAALLVEAAYARTALDTVSPLRLRDPLAPAVAAEREGRAVDPAALRAAYRRLARGRFVVVEGVGGLLVPVTWEWNLADFAAEVGIPVLLVARAGLGTLNDCLLTAEAATDRGLRLLGLVLVPERGGPTDLAGETNPAALGRLLPAVPLLGTMERLDPAAARDPAALASALHRSCDLSPVFAEVDRGDA